MSTILWSAWEKSDMLCRGHEVILGSRYWHHASSTNSIRKSKRALLKRAVGSRLHPRIAPKVTIKRHPLGNDRFMLLGKIGQLPLSGQDESS
jgi:hypothetical protein